MLWFTKAFLKSSLVWLGLGVTLGVAMAAHSAWAVYRPAHLHMLVLGFVAHMIFGVAYHVVPRFSSNPLHAPRAAGAQWWIANAGLAGMVLGFVLRANGSSAGALVLSAGGTLSAISAYLFIWIAWRTVDGPTQAVAAPPVNVTPVNVTPDAAPIAIRLARPT